MEELLRYYKYVIIRDLCFFPLIDALVSYMFAREGRGRPQTRTCGCVEGYLGNFTARRTEVEQKALEKPQFLGRQN